jgi:hypothetical protein
MGGLAEVEPSEALRKSWSELPAADITAIFDRVFSGALVMADSEKRQAAAAEKWKRLNLELRAHEREELFKVCVLGSWPFWMPKLVAGRALGVHEMLQMEALLAGLGKVGRVLRPQRRAPAAEIHELPAQPKGRVGRAEEPVRYITEDGEPASATSEYGRPFEVHILRKRA